MESTTTTGKEELSVSAAEDTEEYDEVDLDSPVASSQPQSTAAKENFDAKLTIAKKLEEAPRAIASATAVAAISSPVVSIPTSAAVAAEVSKKVEDAKNSAAAELSNDKNNDPRTNSVESKIGGDLAVNQSATTAVENGEPPPPQIGATEERTTAVIDGADNKLEEKAEAATTAAVRSVDEDASAPPANSETPDETFERLRKGTITEEISAKEVVNSVFQVLVGGPFDMENKFIIQDPKCIVRMVELLDTCSSTLQAEMWSVFVGIVRKSNKNLESCAAVDLIGLILQRLPQVDDIVADLFIELLGVLASYSVDVKQMKHFLRSLEATGGRWPRHSAKLLYVLKQMPKKEGPDIFFSFSGGNRAGIQVPPLSKWPYQNGWTFCTWLRMDPMNTGIFEREIPYLYSFRTNKSLGYSCHFVGNCLVVTAVKTKAGKGYQLCVKYELQPRKWHHVAFVHVYSRWGKNEVQCYIDGQHITTLDMNWHIGGNDHFDRCFIGYSPDDGRLSSFCGQLGAIYLFAETLNLQQINSIYCLGPGYESCFKFDNETDLPGGYLKFLFDGRLASSIVFAYCPKNCDRQLCLDSSPKDNPSYFVHTPHALMLEGVNVVSTHSVHSTLHSVGGVQVLLPLFGQLDLPHVKADGTEVADYSICSTLLSVIAQLMESSPSVQQQLLQTKGFVVIGNMLLKASKDHITERVLETFLDMATYLLSAPSGGPLLKLLVDHVLIHPGLWIHTDAKLQLRLYNYLSSEFVTNAQFYGAIRRASTVMQMLHALKYYYWLVDPRNKSGYQPKGLDGPRPNTQEIVKIRAYLLLFINKLIMKSDGGPKDDELQALLNYVTTVHEDDNLYDVLETLITLMSDDPASMVPAFDKKKAICAIFKMLASPNELVRLPALKLLGYFLCRSTSKRKQDVMSPNNLFTLLTERLLLHASHITMATYNVLFEILVENMAPETIYGRHPEPESFYRFENPMVLKVIANLISQSKLCPEVMEVKKVFLNDIMALCVNCRENRRTILQMSVWQEWLISLAHIFPNNEEESYVTNLVCQTFCTLLHHAIKLEYGGWRVWVDTLAIVHSKVSFEKFKQDLLEREAAVDQSRRRDRRGASPSTTATKDQQQNGVVVEAEVNKLVSSMVDAVCEDTTKQQQEVEDDDEEEQMKKSLAASKSASGAGKPVKRQDFRPSSAPKPVYRTPEFHWSHIHVKLLSDLLLLIESDVATWKNNSTKNVIDFVNSSENAVFVVNTVHMISQIVDNLIMACGGLLPLLAAATSPNSELEIADTTQQNLRMEIAVTFLIRFANLCDVMVFATALNFSELEQEKNMPAGGILRQCLRLVATMAVRNCLAAKAKTDSVGSSSYASNSNVSKNEHTLAKERAIKALVVGAEDDDFETLKDIVKQAMCVQDPDQLLQEVDLNRLKAVIYRDIEETRQAQFLALGVVYFLSVLMVSRYRDILEPPPSPSPFFNTSRISTEVASPSQLASSSGEAPNGYPEERGGDHPAPTSVDAKSICSVESAVSKESGVGGSREASIQGDAERPKVQAGDTSDAGAADGDRPDRLPPQQDGRPEREPSGAPISSIQVRKSHDGNAGAGSDAEGAGGSGAAVTSSSSTSGATAAGEKYKPEVLKIETVNVNIPRERQATLTTKLKKALETTAPLLREIMTDFHSFLQRTLLGTHGQEIMNDTKVLTTLRNQQGSVVELVMLLCSQEWQTSLQKHAGLAFIELVNEGRLLAHATRDHIVRVANEADFILNRLRAEDVAKHAEFETVCAQTTLTRKEEEKTCDLLITAARRRDCIVASRLNDKILNILCSKHGAWSGNSIRSVRWKLDVWEDDSRRRKRLVPNIYGSNHSEATLKSAAVENSTSEQEIEKDRDILSAHLAGKNIVPPSSVPMPRADELVDDIDIAKAAADEKDFEAESNETASYTTVCKLIGPGLAISGLMSITSNEMFFDCNEDDPEFRKQDPKVIRYCESLHGRWHFNEIRAIFLRRYMLQNVALEIFLAARTAVMFAFPDHGTVKKVVEFLPRVGVGVKYGLPQSRRASLMSARQLFKHSEMPQKWQRREISNFDYLMFLNTISGRTYNDLNQFPVFPWILSNYDSEELDLKQAANFRDLSKPIGALNDSRHAYFVERYNTWEHDKIPPFHYGTHYSTAAFVLHWLIRLEPFTTMFLHLQGNKFDAADRTFHSVGESWRNCLRDTHDVKELIPEFFYLPEMFMNTNGYQFGKRDDGKIVGDIVLPKWAKSPEHFIAVHRQALESDLVSCQLHQWIDLIFGYKQRGPEAVRATNVFYYLTYEGAVDLNSLQDPVMKQAYENQIKNFGQTPSQLLTEPHAPRQSVMTISPLMFQPVAEDLCMVMKFISNSPVVHLSANTYPQLSNPTVISVTASLGYALNRWNNQYSGSVVTPSFSTPSVSEKNEPQAGAGQLPNLPLTVDPLLASGNPSVPLARRHLGEMFDQRLQVKWNNFVTTVDSKFIIACGYPDNSLRVIETESARVRQVVYGHKEVVTCVARSECNLSSDCYLASGSRDCTVLLWHWSARSQSLAGETGTAGEIATPRAVLTGHDTEIVCIVVSAEHGLVISCSQDGPILIHTTSGDLLRCLEPPDPQLKSPKILLMSRDCYLAASYDRGSICVFTTSGRAMKYIHSDRHIGCLCMTRDGEYLVAAGDSGDISVYRLFDLAHLYSYQPCDGAVKSLALAQNHRFILAGLSSGAIIVFNVDFNKWHHEYQQRYSKL